jgi:hypothetical protein
MTLSNSGVIIFQQEGYSSEIPPFASRPVLRSQSSIFRPGVIDSTGAGGWDGAFGGLTMRRLISWIVFCCAALNPSYSSATVYQLSLGAYTVVGDIADYNNGYLSFPISFNITYPPLFNFNAPYDIEISVLGFTATTTNVCPPRACLYSSGPLDAGLTQEFSTFYINASGPFSSIEFFATLPDGFAIAGIPEASTWAMLLIGFAGIGFMAYRRKPKPALMAA